jgi:DNA polymerase-3 subunit epsilon/CBS domain-containing protein
MAKNAQWRGSMATWHERIVHWISRSNPADLLSVDIFFDMRPVYGDARIGHELWREGFALAKGRADFAKLLADAGGTIEPGLTFFGRFNAVGGRLDLKKHGLFGIVTAARVLAVCHHVVERGTLARIEGLRALAIGGENDLAALGEAQGVFLDLIARQQVDDIEHGIAPTNAVAVKSLSRKSRESLRKAIESSQHLEGLVRDMLFKG